MVLTPEGSVHFTFICNNKVVTFLIIILLKYYKHVFGLSSLNCVLGLVMDKICFFILINTFDAVNEV